jgi:hypothetical protein
MQLSLIFAVIDSNLIELRGAEDINLGAGALSEPFLKVKRVSSNFPRSSLCRCYPLTFL